MEDRPMNDVKGPTVMGIHLGTNHSCFGVWVRGKAEIVVNGWGNRTTPSYVAFTREERLVGDAALSRVALNPTNTIFEVEHLMGRKFHDQTVQRKMRSWPFKVVPGSDDRPLVAVRYKGEDKLFSAEEISSMILCQMREIAETFLDQPIKNAVITCPAYFNDTQRRATRDAGVMANLNVVRVLNEPTAAAIAYDFDNLLQGSTMKKNILIFDLGAGTLDVSLLTINKGNIELRAATRDINIGGEDIDNNMVDHVVKQFETKNHVDISDNPNSMRKLRLACEKAKHILSLTQHATIEIDALYHGIDFQTSIVRAKFEDLNEELFLKYLDPLKKCLSDAKMSKFDVDEVVLLGGSTRIPRVQELVQDFFNGKILNRCINPEEVVARGATIYAAMMVGDIPKLVLVDVTPLSLGIELKSGVMSVVIPRNTPFPTKRETYLSIPKEETTAVYYIYEGERIIARENNLLASLKLNGIAPSPIFAPQIKVTFQIDTNGMLNVSALDIKSRNSVELTITIQKGRLSNEEIDRMIEDGRRYKQEDERKKKAIAKNELEKYVSSVKSTLRDRFVASAFTTDQKDMFESKVRIAQEWLNDQSLETEASEYDVKRIELENIFTHFEANIKSQSRWIKSSAEGIM